MDVMPSAEGLPAASEMANKRKKWSLKVAKSGPQAHCANCSLKGLACKSWASSEEQPFLSELTVKWAP